MMIDFGEAEIFEGQMSKTINGGVGRKFAPSHLLEKLAYGFGVHDSQHSARSQAKSSLASAISLQRR
jgi:hypothetical protein